MTINIGSVPYTIPDNWQDLDNEELLRLISELNNSSIDTETFLNIVSGLNDGSLLDGSTYDNGYLTLPEGTADDDSDLLSRIEALEKQNADLLSLVDKLSGGSSNGSLFSKLGNALSSYGFGSYDVDLWKENYKEKFKEKHAGEDKYSAEGALDDAAEKRAKNWANAGRTMQWVGLGSDVLSSFLPENTAYSGDKGEITSTIDQAYDKGTSALMSLGPFGAVAGGALKGLGALNQGLSALGVGTSGMTTMDSIMSSNLFGWNIGLVNSLGAKTTDKINKDYDTFALAGSSYTGTSNLVDDAVHKSDKKYGTFSTGAYTKAQDTIHLAQLQQNKLAGITKEASNRMNLKSSMSGTNAVRRRMLLNGGYRLNAVRAGHWGMTLMPRVQIANIISAARGRKLEKQTSFKNLFVDKISNGTKIGNPYYYQYNTGDAINNFVMPLQEPVADVDSEPEYGTLYQGGIGDLGLKRVRAKTYTAIKQEGGTIYTAEKPAGGGKIDKTKIDPNGNYSDEEEDLSWIKEVPMIEIEGYDDMSDDQKKWAVLDAVKNMKNPPRWVQRLNEPARGIWFIENGVLQRGSHLISDDPIEEGDDYLFSIVFPQIQEIDGKLTFIEDKREAMDRALASGNYIKFPKDELAILLGKYYKEAWPEVFPNYEPQMENTVFDVAEDIAPYIDPRFLREIGLDDASLLHVLQGDNAHTDGNTIYITADGDLYELLAHELTHWLYDLGKINADLYKPYWQDLDDKKLADMGADLEFVKRTGDINDFYSPAELLARINAARGMSGEEGILNEWLPTFFGLVRDGDENMYGDNFRDLLHMFNDETLSEIFKKAPIVLFLHGGAMNVIPDGALHKERHGMEKIEGLEDVTRKGIPVVSEEEEGLVQLAEIERSELIFRLEVTEKLEELYKKYYDDNTSAEEKDAVAIEAGKLLAEEIIHNTDDKTNNII